MIQVIPKTTGKATEALGELSTFLLRVAEDGIRTVPSIVVGKNLFATFLHHTKARRSDFTYLLAETTGAIGTYLDSRVDIRVSSDVPQPSFPEFTSIRNKPRSLKQAILDIFSEWSDDKFHAFRIVEGLKGSSSYPALLIQNHVRREFSLVSREPTTGARITASNIDFNVDIVVKSFRPAHAKFLKRVECSLGFPVKLFFAETPNLQLCRVEKATMTTAGWLSALSSMKAEGALDDMHALCLIQPDMIAEYTGRKALLETASLIATGFGLPVSSGYASGEILLPHDPLPTNDDPRIFVCTEESPEDIGHVDACQGGLGARGGMTSHLAIVLRGMGKPGITGVSDMTIERNSIHVGDKNIPEHAFVYVDGNTGRFAFSLKPFLTAPEYEAGADRVLLETVLSELNLLIQNHKKFASLSVDTQLHMSRLVRAFNLIRKESS